MYCTFCGAKQGAVSNFCHSCGKQLRSKRVASENGANQFPKASLATGVVSTAEILQVPFVQTQTKKYSTLNECTNYFMFSILTFGLYSAYWGWRRWELVGKLKNEKTSPTLSGIFLGFTSFSLFGNIKTLSHARTEGAPSLAPGLWGSLLLLSFAMSNGLGRSNMSFGSYLLAFVVLSFFETLVIASPSSALVHLLNNDDEARDAYEKIGHNVALIVILVIIAVGWILVGVASSQSTGV